MEEIRSDRFVRCKTLVYQPPAATGNGDDVIAANTNLLSLSPLFKIYHRPRRLTSSPEVVDATAETSTIRSRKFDRIVQSNERKIAEPVAADVTNADDADGYLERLLRRHRLSLLAQQLLLAVDQREPSPSRSESWSTTWSRTMTKVPSSERLTSGASRASRTTYRNVQGAEVEASALFEDTVREVMTKSAGESRSKKQRANGYENLILVDEDSYDDGSGCRRTLDPVTWRTNLTKRGARTLSPDRVNDVTRGSTSKVEDRLQQNRRPLCHRVSKSDFTSSGRRGHDDQRLSRQQGPPASKQASRFGRKSTAVTDDRINNRLNSEKLHLLLPTVGTRLDR